MSGWRPDWQNESAYTQTLEAREWAWEFLRRNPEYQRDYAHFAALPDSDPIVGVKNGKWEGAPSLEGQLDNFYCNPPASAGETLHEYEQRLKRDGIDDWCVLSFAEYMTRHYKMEPIPCDPISPLPYYVDFSDWATEDSLPPWYVTIDESGYFMRFQHMPIYAFDINQSIDKQLEVVRAQLLDRIERFTIQGTFAPIPERRNQLKKYPIYLRLLDADFAGADIQKMVEVLYPGDANNYPDYSASRKARQQLKAARLLRDSDYWLVSALSGRAREK